MASVTPIHGEPADRLQQDISTIVRMLMALNGNLNQQGLADRTGIAQPVISARFRHVSRWTVEDLERLAAALQVDPGVFFRDPKGFTPSVLGVPYSVPQPARRRRASRGQDRRSNGCLSEAAA
jgi:transcriptional regulator with XRE-family HTH domain